MLQLMGAAVGGMGLGLKAYSVTREGVRFVVLLWDEVTGKLQAVIEADRLGQIRTGAATGVATKLLARADADTVGIIGSGWQARSQLEAVCAVRTIRTARVFSPNPSHREAFAREMEARTGVTVEAMSDIRKAVAGASIIVTITKADSPVLEGGLIEAGVHINAAGSNRSSAQEIDLETVRRADRIFIDSRSQGKTEAGDLIPAVEANLISWSDVAELADLVAGKAEGRVSEEQITLFESLGIAIEDVAAARTVYEKARSVGIGTEIQSSALG
jgi:ornithine cyclodeaminase/alanine dehydrogenase-like protein (mu-crystallin family)